MDANTGAFVAVVGFAIAIAVVGIVAKRWVRVHLLLGAVLWSLGCVLALTLTTPRLAPSDKMTLFGTWAIAVSLAVYFHINAIRAATRLWNYPGLLVWLLILVAPFVLSTWRSLPEFVFLAPIWLFALIAWFLLRPQRS